MGLRRIIGGALALLLLVTAALPDLCGECRARKAEQGCAGNHEGAAPSQHERHASAVVMSAGCDSCADHRGAATAELSAGTKAYEFSIMNIAHLFCGAVDRRIAVVSAVESFNLKSDETAGVDTDVPLIMVHYAGLTLHGNTSGGETIAANSAYEPLFVSLKI
jgi:hypothetical protein